MEVWYWRDVGEFSVLSKGRFNFATNTFEGYWHSNNGREGPYTFMALVA